MGVENVGGKLSLLRVHDRGSRFGPPGDDIDVEVIVQFAARPNEAFGFQLRNDANGPAREGMLGLLRDGFNQGHMVHIDYERDSAGGKKHGTAFRVWLTRAPGRASGGAGHLGRPVNEGAPGPGAAAADSPRRTRAKPGKRQTSARKK